MHLRRKLATISFCRFIFNFAGRVTPSSPPHVPRESSNSPSDDKQPTQSQSGKDGQQTTPMSHNMAASLWEYLMAFSTQEIVLAVLSAVIIGLLITSCCQRKGNSLHIEMKKSF